ncbi:N-acetyltransferase [Insulibacter thermoxylanivorax]|uniref:N-acetyltransferase n=1 Tax=Insulibacter thermoxylanivorax TaxID=2749268 RepID=A0A916QBA6_9BACL|nr:GNAT family N-acetyltransferase [Insulibacter thermoxylanivorax]GFR37586.1 N-acetyltransferase [Insulibacter thermoxylanivorax]
MFEDVKSLLKDIPELVELLSYSIVPAPEPEELEQIVEEYRTNPSCRIYALAYEDEWIGIIGYEKQENGVIEIRHIAVHPGMRGSGFGRGLILELIGVEEDAKELYAVTTDEMAVDFFRNIGFTIESIDELYPGIERFRCRYLIDESVIDEDE